MEPTKDNDDHLNAEKENKLGNFEDEKTCASFDGKKRSVPVSSLSASEDEVQETTMTQGIKRSKTAENSQEDTDKVLSLPTLKIQPILGGKPLTFPVHPRLTLIDLRDFILFTLNIPHPQQILSFHSSEEDKIVMLSNYSENTLLCSVPGLIDELTGRCAPVSLSFKISSGMDFSVHPSDVEYDNTSAAGGDDDDDSNSESSGYFEILGNGDDPTSVQLSALASSIASLIPLPPGVEKSSRMLFRSLSKSSPTNSNLPTLWEIYFPESGVKMMVTALINVNEVKEEGENESKDNNVAETETTVPNDIVNPSDAVNPSNTVNPSDTNNSSETVKVTTAPTLVITPPPPPPTNTTVVTSTIIPSDTAVPTIITTTSSIQSDNVSPSSSTSEKLYCEKCRIKCRPALRFICKCNKTFCQSHRYPDKHDCTFDHRADGIATIQANNPKIVKDKIGNF